jgi:hypothetical protein
MKQLLIFGDSWPQGSELKSGEKTFGQILAEGFHCPWHNFAQPSTSIPHLVQQLRHAVWTSKQEESKFEIAGSTAVFFLTSPDRDLIWQDGEETEIHPGRDGPTIKQWYFNIYSQDLANYRTNTTLLALREMCRQHEINDYYLWGWTRTKLWSEIDCSRVYDNGISSALDMFDDHVTHPRTLIQYINTRPNKYVYPNDGHPNQAGHQLIADNLYQWLSNRNH